MELNAFKAKFNRFTFDGNNKIKCSNGHGTV